MTPAACAFPPNPQYASPRVGRARHSRVQGTVCAYPLRDRRTANLLRSVLARKQLPANPLSHRPGYSFTYRCFHRANFSRYVARPFQFQRCILLIINELLAWSYSYKSYFTEMSACTSGFEELLNSILAPTPLCVISRCQRGTAVGPERGTSGIQARWSAPQRTTRWARTLWY